MKRYITILLSVVMILQVSVCVQADVINWNEYVGGSTTGVTDNILSAEEKTEVLEDNDAEQTDYTFEKLNALGIANEKSDVITRADFISMAMRAIGADNTWDRQIFLDVAKTHECAGYINAAYELGIISGSNGLYEPDKKISYIDAVVIAVRLLGRNDAAVALGGYPAGYVAAAQKYKLLTGVKADDTASLYTLILNTVESTNLAILEGYKNGEGVYTTDKTRNILSYYRKIYSYEGIVSAVGPSNIYTNSVGEENTVKIDEEKFVGTYDKYITALGMQCEALYKEIDGRKHLVYIDTDDYNRVLEIKSEDINSFSLNKYTYFDGDKKRYATVNKDASVVYNGRIATNRITDLYVPQNGNVTLISNDGDGNYDVVIVKSVSDIVVGTVVTDGDYTAVYDYYDKNKFVSFDYSDTDTIVNLVNTDGKLTYPAMLLNRNILSVSKSADNKIVTGIQSVKTVSGTISSIAKRNSSTTVEINGTEYSLTEECAKNCSKLIVSGANVTLGINAFGKASDVYEYAGISDGLNYAYVIGTDETDGLTSDVMIKFLNYDGEILIKTLDAKCRIDGESYKDASSQKKALNNGLSYGEVIRYQLNSEGFINIIDTLYTNTSKEEEKTTLRKIFDALPTGSGYSYKAESKRGNFGEKFFWDTQYTTVFLIYENETSDRKRYRVPKLSFPWKNDSSHIPDAYSHTDTFYANAIVDKISASEDNISDRTLYIVEEITNVPSEYSEAVMIKLNAGKGTISVSMEKADFAEKDIEAGDIVRCDYVDGEVLGANIKKYYDYDTKLISYIKRDEVAYKNNDFFMRKGYIYDKKGEIYSIYASGVEDDTNKIYTPGSVAELANPDETKIFVNRPSSAYFVSYEKNDRGNVTVSSASMADLKPYLGCGEDCSEVIVNSMFMTPQQIIILK